MSKTVIEFKHVTKMYKLFKNDRRRKIRRKAITRI